MGLKTEQRREVGGLYFNTFLVPLVQDAFYTSSVAFGS
jgi:hypothetical protein